MKAVLLATFVLALATPRLADAHDECRHGFTFGKEGPFCGQDGSGYWVPALRFELGSLHRQIVLTQEDAIDSGLAEGTFAANGGRFRFSWGGFGLYTGGELSVAGFEGIAMPGLARTIGLPDASTDAWLVETGTFIGARRSTGRLVYGIELMGGIRNAWIDGAPPEMESAAGLLEVRSNLGVWLSPFVSLHAQLGQSLIHRDEQLVFLALGVSVFPWDGLR